MRAGPIRVDELTATPAVARRTTRTDDVRAPVSLLRTAGNAALGAALRPHVQRAIDPGRFNVVGENHDESDAGPRRSLEKKYAKDHHLDYWTESEFRFDKDDGTTAFGDDLGLLVLQSASFVAVDLRALASTVATARDAIAAGEEDEMEEDHAALARRIGHLHDELDELDAATDELRRSGAGEDLVAAATGLVDTVRKAATTYRTELREIAGETAPKTWLSRFDTLVARLVASLDPWRTATLSLLREHGFDSAQVSPNAQSPEQAIKQSIVVARSRHMMFAASRAAQVRGIWKVGEEHVGDMREEKALPFALTSRAEFNITYAAWLSASHSDAVGTTT